MQNLSLNNEKKPSQLLFVSVGSLERERMSRFIHLKSKGEKEEKSSPNRAVAGEKEKEGERDGGGKAEGVLTVQVVKGEGLLPMDFGVSSDPFVVLRLELGDSGKKEKEKEKEKEKKKSVASWSTRVVPRSLNPVWNEGTSFAIPSDVEGVAKVRIIEKRMSVLSEWRNFKSDKEAFSLSLQSHPSPSFPLPYPPFLLSFHFSSQCRSLPQSMMRTHSAATTWASSPSL